MVAGPEKPEKAWVISSSSQQKAGDIFAYDLQNKYLNAQGEASDPSNERAIGLTAKWNCCQTQTDFGYNEVEIKQRFAPAFLDTAAIGHQAQNRGKSDLRTAPEAKGGESWGTYRASDSSEKNHQ